MPEARDVGVPAADVRSRVLTGTRVLFGVTVVGALVTGFAGMRDYVDALAPEQFGTGFWNIAYYDLQLFVLGARPLDLPGPYPLLLNVARFAAPAATIYALFEAGRAIFTGQFRRWRVRRRRGNIIVVGQTTAARVLAAKLLAASPTRRRRRVVTVGAGDTRTLRDAGVARASVVYAFADDASDSTLNVATALAAAEATGVRTRRARRGRGWGWGRGRGWGRRRRAKLRVYAHVSNPTLALALRARRLGLANDDGLDVDFVNLDEVAARGLLAAEDVTVDPARHPHILVAGLGAFGRAILVEYAMAWRLHSPRRDERVMVTLVDPRASTVAAQLAAGWDILGEVCDLTPVDGSLVQALRASTAPTPHRVFICYDDEELALSEALTTVELWRGGRRSIVVRLNRLARHGEVFHAPGRTIGEDIGGRLRLVGLTEIACDPELIAKDLDERLAEAIHERYLLEQIRNGTRLDDPDRPAMRRWSDLPDTLRDANRAQAGDIGGKLTMIDATVAPRVDGGGSFAFSPTEVEALAEREHDRWCDERRAEGLVYGPTRKGKYHPSLVSWAELPEPERNKDRQAVRNLPAILADVGLQVVRLSGHD